MRRLLLFFIITFSFVNLIADEPPKCPKWWQIRSILLDYDRFSWQSVKSLRALEKPCVNADENRTLGQYLATIEGKIGNHHAGLKWIDRIDASTNSPAKPLDEFIAIDALPYVVERSKDHRIVITNERHHASTDRLLPLHLLNPLHEQGFRYLAVETLGSNHTINELDYVTIYDGYYTNDVVYAELLRSARALGYRIVAYEQEDDQFAPEDPENPINRSTERDHWQAKNIISRVFEVDPNAKVLIHCGYGHVSEEKLRNSLPMAYFLKKITGLDPLSISQTHFSERSETQREHPWRRQVAEHGLLDDNPKVLLNSKNELIGSGGGTDIRVIGLKTRYENGRPVWMRMGGIRKPVTITTPECKDRSCVVEVFDPTEDKDAIPFDRFEVVQSSIANAYIPENKPIKIRMMDLDGNILNERDLSTSDQ